MILGKQLVFCAALIGPAQVQIGFAHSGKKNR